jgi:hypothetical protein
MQAVAETAGIRNKAGNCCAERNTGLLKSSERRGGGSPGLGVGVSHYTSGAC